MWHLTRIHLDRIGAPAAWFRDVKIELADEFGEPLDTIAWLRNGGGKSTVLSLVCAQLRPKRTDFLAASITAKHIEDYIASGDTAHVMLEWSEGNGRRLITGAVYEWDGQQAPEDPAKNHDRLHQVWYCLTPTEQMHTEDLPITTADGTRRRFEDYKTALRALPPALDVAVCVTQDRWAKALDAHGMDPELLTPILTMNATEGGIDAAFSFTGAEGFVRYLLSLVANPAAAASVAHTLEKVRRQLAERPKVEADHTFASEAVPLLEQLAVAYREHQDAIVEAAAAENAGAELAAALAAGAGRAEERAEIDESRVDTQREAARAARTARDTATTTAAELRRIAAVIRQATAVTTLAAAETTHGEARRRVDALAAVGPLSRAHRQRARVDELSRQMTETERGAAPLAESRDSAAAAFRRALTRTLGDMDRAAAVRSRATEDAEGRRDAARAGIKAARDEISTLTARGRELRGVVDGYATALRAAIPAGVLRDGEEPATVHAARTTADSDAEQEIVEIDGRRAEIRDDLVELRDTLKQLRAAERAAHDDVRAARAAEQELADAVARIAAYPAVNEIAQADDVDVLDEAHELHARFTERAHRADAERMRHAVDTADDRRALDELERSELLPPAVDVEKALLVMAEADIPATSGWRYLADNVPVADQPRVYRQLPALVAGVAVHDPSRLDDARAALGSAQLRPTTAIAVGTTVDLQQALTATDPAHQWLIPPADGLTDRAVARTEQELRQLAVADADTRDSQLVAQRDTDSTVAMLLHQLAARWTPAERDRLAAATPAARDRQAAATGATQQAERREHELTAQDQQLDGRRSDLQTDRRHAAAALARLADLVERGEAAAQAGIELSGLPHAERVQREALAAAEDAEVAADEVLLRLRDETTEAARQRRNLKVELSALPGADPDRGADVPLAAARDLYREAERAYEQATSGSPLASQLDEARRALAEYSAAVDVLDPVIWSAAQELLDDDTDPQQIAALTGQAQTTLAAADRDRVNALTELKLAEDEVSTHTPDGRTRHRVLDGPEPATRDRALELASAADNDRENALADENRATAAATEHEATATRLRQHARDLKALLPALPPPAETGGREPSVFDGSREQAEERATTARDRLHSAEEAERRLGRVFDEASKTCFLWANAERFSTVKPEIRSRFRTADVAADLAPTAAELAEHMRQYAASAAAHLAELDEHQRAAVTAMRGMVRGALQTLRRVQNASTLPSTLPSWEGRRFLEVGPKRSLDLSDAILDDRIGRVVDALVASGTEIPSGADLLWVATHAVVGDGNWQARILKPTVDGSVTMVSVPRMRKWSGGEKVTANLLLFALAVRVRAQERGRDHVGFGVLPLDNPLGKASYVPFLELQRKVAAAYGIQLLFLTGVADLRAVGRFPNIVRLKNRSARERGYVGVVDRHVDESASVGLVRQARVFRPDPIPGL
jgi:hypothetical protein